MEPAHRERGGPAAPRERRRAVPRGRTRPAVWHQPVGGRGAPGRRGRRTARGAAGPPRGQLRTDRAALQRRAGRMVRHAHGGRLGSRSARSIGRPGGPAAAPRDLRSPGAEPFSSRVPPGDSRIRSHRTAAGRVAAPRNGRHAVLCSGDRAESGGGAGIAHAPESVDRTRVRGRPRDCDPRGDERRRARPMLAGGIPRFRHCGPGAAPPAAARRTAGALEPLAANALC
jgi:hypothetical protein